MSYLTVKKLDNILNKGYDLNVFISDRAGRKSSVCQEFFIKQAMNDKPFALIRGKTDESITTNWLSEYVQNKYKDFVFWNEQIDNYIGAIYFKKNSESDTIYLLCYTLYLSVAKKYKSNYFKGFEKISYIVWEECIPNQRIVQDVKYINNRLMNELINIVSIGSTISRGKKLQYIFLGNDIKTNLINPITVCFDILERLSVNCEIIDNCIIDDRKYTYYFNYFDFPGAVNHWLINTDINIDNTISVQNQERYPYILITNHNRYYIYNFEKFNYITTEKNNKIVDVIENDIDFFNQYQAEHLLKKYDLKIALTMLITFYNVSFDDISRYYGENWQYYTPKFHKQQNVAEYHIFNLSELAGMVNSQILNINNYAQLQTIMSLLNSKPLIANNIQVLIYIKDLSLKLAGLI